MTWRSIDGFNVNDVGNHAKPEVHGASQRKLAREFPMAKLAALRCDLGTDSTELLHCIGSGNILVIFPTPKLSWYYRSSSL